ncbi:DUF2163 domain-containing protein [Corticibacterium sp. UT-5YL-CI-8]|nr:DUF2163 domain-containing protein [Tianweitania sp. UT-5YL-CI-8]
MSRYPEALSEHLVGTVTTLCHCWRLTRSDGLAIGFTDHDRTLEIGGLAYEPASGFTASEARDTLGMAVDTQDIEGALSSERIRDEDVSAGLYDGAVVETLLVNWREPGVHAVIRKAAIGKIVRSDNSFVAELQSASHTLDRPQGRIISRRCDAELGDARCGFLLAQEGFSGTGTVLALPGVDTLLVEGIETFEPGWFSHGRLTWTSGAAAGRAFRIVHHRAGTEGVVLVVPPEALRGAEAGDAFTVEAGCDKSFATCKAKFANALNFRGFPHLPGNDTAYGYVSDNGVFDGGPVVP